MALPRLVIAVLSTMSCAHRLRLKRKMGGVPHVGGFGPVVIHDPMIHINIPDNLKPKIGGGPHVWVGPVVIHDPMIHINIPDNLARPPLETGVHSADDPPVWSNATGWAAPRWWEWTANISDAQITEQLFPPTEVYNIDAMELLHSWIDPFLDPSADTKKKIASLYKNDRLPVPPKTPKSSLSGDKEMVLQKMRDVAFHRLIQIEIVGLLPKDLEMSELDASLEAYVSALGIFSRGWLEDDCKGSLRNFMASRDKDLRPARWWHPSMATLHGNVEDKRFLQEDEHSTLQLGVFAIEGLADAPGLDELSAKVLLSKIDKYAAQEKRVVVVSKRAYISSDGVDLTEYYVRLGFEKAVMAEGLPQLVYAKGWSQKKDSSSAEDLSAEHQQIMVGMNLRTGASG